MCSPASSFRVICVLSILISLMLSSRSPLSFLDALHCPGSPARCECKKTVELTLNRVRRRRPSGARATTLLCSEERNLLFFYDIQVFIEVCITYSSQHNQLPSVRLYP